MTVDFSKYNDGSIAVVCCGRGERHEFMDLCEENGARCVSRTGSYDTVAYHMDDCNGVRHPRYCYVGFYENETRPGLHAEEISLEEFINRYADCGNIQFSEDDYASMLGMM